MGEILGENNKGMTSDELSVIDKKYKKSKISVRLGYEMTVNGKLPGKQ